MKAIIEIPSNSLYKFESKDNKLVLDRTLKIRTPVNYGYIPNTLCGDGDPLDVFILSQDPLPALCEVDIVVVGAFVCNDNGESDDKILAFIRDENFKNKEILVKSVRTYLENYKEGFSVISEESVAKAMELIDDSSNLFDGELGF